MKTIVIQHELPDWSDWYVQQLDQAFPGHDFRAAHSDDQAMAHAPDAHAFMGIAPKMKPALVAAMPRLEWIQSMTTGIDNLLAQSRFARSGHSQILELLFQKRQTLWRVLRKSS